MAKAQVGVAGAAPRSAGDRLAALRARPADLTHTPGDRPEGGVRPAAEDGPGVNGTAGAAWPSDHERPVYLGSDRWRRVRPDPEAARPTAPFGTAVLGADDPDALVFERAPFGAVRLEEPPPDRRASAAGWEASGPGAPGWQTPGQGEQGEPTGRPGALRWPTADHPVSPAETTAPLPVVGAGGRLSGLAERWLPAGWRSARLDPGRPGATAVVVVAALAAVVAAIGVWWDRPVAEPPPAFTSVAPAPAPAAGTGESMVPAGSAGRPSTPLVVSVAGEVRRPGLVRLPDGSRVADAITEAGGPLRGTDLTPLNLARRVADGEQILVGLPLPPDAPSARAGTAGPATGAVPGGGAGGGAAAGKIDLNRATVEQLDTLPGVGPVTAQRILAWRSAHGRFGSVDQLREIEGIGERRFAQLRDQVTV